MAADQCKALAALEEHGGMSKCVAAEVSKQVLSILNQQFASQIESVVRSVLVEQGEVHTNNTEREKLDLCVQCLVKSWHAGFVGQLQDQQPDSKAQQVKKPRVKRKRQAEMCNESVYQIESMQRQKIINEAFGNLMDTGEERQERRKVSERKSRSCSKQRSSSRDPDSTIAWLRLWTPKKVFPFTSWRFSSRGGSEQFTKIVPDEVD